MPSSRRRRRLTIGSHHAEVGRTEHGVAEIWAEDELAQAAALGWAHAEDRLVQMTLLRLVGQGRLGECLKADETTLGIDLFMREMGFRRDAEADTANLDPATAAFAEAYCHGVNHWLERQRRPLELLLVGHRPEPWRPADLLLAIKLMSYVGLAQSQQDMEKAIVQAVQAGVDLHRLRRLFSPHLDGLDETTADLLRRLTYTAPLIPPHVRFAPLPRIMASNNWAVAGRRSASGHAILCGDPHLEVNRLPAIWYEAVIHGGGDDRLGITMPGVPGLVMGRTRRVAFTFTYGFMDMIDFAIEEVRDGAVRRGDRFVPLDIRRETVPRKGRSPITLTVRESDLGVVEADGLEAELADGLYLARAWSAHRHGAAASLAAVRRMPEATTVAEAAAIAREVTISCNWLLADHHGDIAYQQSGLLPDRRHSGLHPVPAWESEPPWRGLHPTERLLHRAAPEDGLLVTANDDHNPAGGPLAVNLSMGPYRAERIRQLLEAAPTLDLETMEAIQLDLHSTQADLFMPLLEPALPDSPAGRLLRHWDRRYDPASRGATLFERLYHALLERVFGDGLLGREAWRAIIADTALHADYYWHFDRALLDGDGPWWGDEGREAVLAEVVAATLTDLDPTSVETWGEHQRITMTNIFFAGTLPGWLGFDHGPVALPGGRSTIIQGGVFSSHGRTTTFAPSWRMITDLGSDEARTVLAGGPSGRRTSPLYASEIDDWLAGRYKRLRLGPVDDPHGRLGDID